MTMSSPAMLMKWACVSDYRHIMLFLRKAVLKLCLVHSRLDEIVHHLEHSLGSWVCLRKPVIGLFQTAQEILPSVYPNALRLNNCFRLSTSRGSRERHSWQLLCICQCLSQSIFQNIRIALFWLIVILVVGHFNLCDFVECVLSLWAGPHK